MGERKVLNKYYPPDFDPAEMPKRKRPKTNDMKVRMMLPMTVQCRTCGHFMYKGTKFNTRKEDVLGENYLGIQIFRFYYRCRNCAAEFTMKTDPKTSDYLLEAGASRNYEPWREQEKEKVLTQKEREEEEMGNAMKALENRTLESKREMDIMAALDEMRTLKARQSQVTTEQALEALQREASKQVQGGLAAEEAADLQEFYALRAQQQHRQSATKLLDDDTSSTGEEEDPSTHFKTRVNGQGAAAGQGAGRSGIAAREPASSSRGPATSLPSTSSSSGAATAQKGKGAAGGAGRSLAALAMLEDGEEEGEEEAGRNRHQQRQQESRGGGGGVQASGGGQRQEQGDGPAQSGMQLPPYAAGSGGHGEPASQRVEREESGGDLLSEALASVHSKDRARQQPNANKPQAVKPQIRVVAKPKAAPAPAPAQAGNQDESQVDGPGGLGLLGSYGSSSSTSSGGEEDNTC